MMTILETEVICIVLRVSIQDGFQIKIDFPIKLEFYLKPISVKQMYFACAPARNYKLKEDASYKRGILHR